MQIPSSTHNSVSRVPNGPQLSTRASVIASSPNAQGHRPHAVPGGEAGGGKISPATPQERLADAGSNINDRLAHLMGGEELSSEQTEALMAAQEQFNTLLDRMSNALDNDGFEQKGKLQRAFAFAMNSLRDDVKTALNTSTPDAPNATEEGASTVGEKAADLQKAADFQKVDSGGAGSVAGSVAAPGDAEAVELKEYRSGIDARLENFASVNNLDDDQLAALANAHDQFDSIMNRVQYGLDHGTLSFDQVEQGYKVALSGLRQDVNGILGSEDEPGGDKTLAADVGTITNQEPQSLSDRLQAAFDSVDSRLSNMIGGGNAAASELKGLQENFGAVFDRLQNALDNGFSEKRAGDIFTRMMDGLRHDVSEVQNQAQQGDQPKIYDQGGVATDLNGGLGTTGYDNIG